MKGKPAMPVAAPASAPLITVRREMPLRSLIVSSSWVLLWNNDRMDLEIQGLRVMVSAGANGIGLEIARAFVREGARVHVCDVDQAALAKLAKSDRKLTATRCDVSNRDQVALFFEEGLAALGGLDCLVNNA